MIQDLSKRF